MCVGVIVHKAIRMDRFDSSRHRSWSSRHSARSPSKALILHPQAASSSVQTSTRTSRWRTNSDRNTLKRLFSVWHVTVSSIIGMWLRASCSTRSGTRTTPSSPVTSLVTVLSSSLQARISRSTFTTRWPGNWSLRCTVMDCGSTVTRTESFAPSSCQMIRMSAWRAVGIVLWSSMTQE